MSSSDTRETDTKKGEKKGKMLGVTWMNNSLLLNFDICIGLLGSYFSCK